MEQYLEAIQNNLAELNKLSGNVEDEDLGKGLETIHNVQAIAENLAKDVGKKFFNAHSKALFLKHPEITSVSWTQYTPYFNDGDECVFGVNREYFISAEGDTPDTGEYDDDPFSMYGKDVLPDGNVKERTVSGYKNRQTGEVYKTWEDVPSEVPSGSNVWRGNYPMKIAVETLYDYVVRPPNAKEKFLPEWEKFLDKFDDDDLKALFGDHVRVIVTPDGIETDDYEHE